MAEALLKMEHGLMHAMRRLNHPAVMAIVHFLVNYHRYQTQLQNYAKLCALVSKTTMA
jgi:hypothetical protein